MSTAALAATSTLAPVSARGSAPAALEPVLDRTGAPVRVSDWLAAHTDGRPDLVLGYQGEPHFLLQSAVDGTRQLEAYALRAECTHLGCLVADDPMGGYACPCHGSKYSRDGTVLRGPAPKPLRLARVEAAADGTLQMGDWVKADFRQGVA